MLRTIEDHHVSYMHMITTLMVDVVKLDPDVFMNVDTTSMRQTWCGGGAMSPDMIGEYERKVGGLVCEGWGRSEGGLSWNPPQVDRRLLGSQGRLMDQIFAMKIVDVEGHEVPVGQTGEIVARGDTVITSYWRRQDLDAALFDDEAWLRTGDAASLDEDGFLHFQGRIDHMIKTGGENVYPAEVEEALLDMPGVQDAAVLGTPDERLGQLVTAVVVPLDDAISSDAVEEWGRKTLAGYKRPRRVIVVEAIPRLANEKVDYPQVRRMLEATAGLRSVDDH